jgi:hypothetical protein
MSNLVCKNCKSVAVEYEDYCGGTSYFRCKTCGMRGNKDKFTQVTVFDRITRSPEVLASRLVHIFVCEHDTSIKGWTSNIIFDVFDTYEEAIAATVARLKEMAE